MILLVVLLVLLVAGAGAGLLGIGVLSDDRRRKRSGLAAVLLAPVVLAGVVIVVAGMDGALASVVGGLVRVPVIAVPTSVGYGAAFHGLAPLLTMLNCCAAGVTVVNIDNGFGAAVAAARILH